MALPHARTNLPRAFRAFYPAEQWFECEAIASFGDDTDFGRVDVVIDVTDPGGWIQLVVATPQDGGVAMGVGKRQRAIRAMRGRMWSPGRPSTAQREDRVRFWETIARGMSSEDAVRRLAWHPRLGPVGSVRVVGCRRSVWLRCRAAICRSPSERRSRYCMPNTVMYARLHAA